MLRFIHFVFLCLFSAVAFAAPPANFSDAKKVARSQVYQDRNNAGDMYCGCNWEWQGASGGKVDLNSCGYKVRAQLNRAQRIEWEHIVPASTFGRQRQCWQHGGRQNCQATDPVFNVMEADLHNLTPVVGEVNADRNNFNMGMAAIPNGQYGQCPFKVDFQSRIAEPPNAYKGMAARIHFYMADRYGLNFSDQQERILMAWDKAYPPSAWELERNRRITRITNVSNPFVTGEKKWVTGYRSHPSNAYAPTAVSTHPPAAINVQPQTAPVIGNKNSKIYHVRGLCPGYDATAPQNRVAFTSEAAALAAGFRKAGNCK